ncbi:hypothetical protein KTH81_01655 [Lachnospiraceae bacterium ASD3451]|uniref:CFI-box-CTERM domain-containing protein n=1 Tax=Diplocloster agilis TaxID=2850323 RepID=UPI001D56FB55|nr:CFI-box-CTERM domain-containing protein [Diplocloster agilis]MBU9742514.1 hypothetical protein [Diplocloster agilis]
MSLVAAKCTQCGANIEVDDTKEAGICQYCGTAFITEKAINNFNSYTVNVNNFSGANVIMNNKQDINNLLQLARRFRKDCNSIEAAKYYNMILTEDPSNWEAYFYCNYYKVCSIRSKSQIQESAMSMVLCLDTVLDMIDKNLQDDNSKVIALKEVASSYYLLSTFLHNALLQTDGLNNIPVAEMSQHITSVAITCVYIATIEYMVGDKFNQKFPELSGQLQNEIVMAWKQGVEFHIDCYKQAPNQGEGQNIINSYVEKIKKIDSSYIPPEKPSSGGCYIATCVYGSYDCPQVWTLRRYRDYTLAPTWYGRAFIRMYYKISPKLVKWFGSTAWFQNIWKRKLDKMVEWLQDNGVEDTPYNDLQ